LRVKLVNINGEAIDEQNACLIKVDDGTGQRDDGL